MELYTGYIFLSGFGLALGLIFLYLMMNNPGDYIDSTTGAFDKNMYPVYSSTPIHTDVYKRQKQKHMALRKLSYVLTLIL